jgi:precorrin isomerase
MKPEEIEADSFRTIEAEAGEHGRSEAEWQVLRRVIHTSADFEYVRTLIFRTVRWRSEFPRRKAGPVSSPIPPWPRPA